MSEIVIPEDGIGRSFYFFKGKKIRDEFFVRWFFKKERQIARNENVVGIISIDDFDCFF